LVTLFANNTTIYLSEENSFNKLNEILTDWCMALVAKFNINKTEIIPIGLREHQDRVIESRRFGLDNSPIPSNIRIAKQGELIRALGAFVGNNVSQSRHQPMTIERVREKLEKWNRRADSQIGRRLIVLNF
jgi:hypothetical protein